MAASESKFHAHGLITSPALEIQYLVAHIANYKKAKHDPREYETVELLENIFNKVVFNRDDIFVNSQQPPGMHSKKACDIVIKYIEKGTFLAKILCFVECKRSKKKSHYSLKVVEEQALGYCKEYLKATGASFVYAATALGAHIRLWKYSEGEAGLTPFWGSRTPGAWKYYKDVGVNKDGAELLQCFLQMHTFPPSLAEGQQFADYGSQFAHLRIDDAEADDDDDDDDDDDEEDDEEEDDEDEDEDGEAGASMTEVQPTKYTTSGGRNAIAFVLRGEQISTWQDDWDFLPEESVMILKKYNVFFRR
jgi:hypothetical protein